MSADVGDGSPLSVECPYCASPEGVWCRNDETEGPISGYCHAVREDKAMAPAPPKVEAWPLSVPCPQCGAPERVWCLSGRGSNIGNVHDARRSVASMSAAELQELCDLAVGIWCRNRDMGLAQDLHALTDGVSRVINEVNRLRAALDRSFAEIEELRVEVGALRSEARKRRREKHECKPTQWAYDQAVKALNVQRDKAVRHSALLGRIADLISEEEL